MLNCTVLFVAPCIKDSEIFDQFCAVDGIFATVGTMVPFMRQWIFIYTKVPWLAKMLPTAYYRHVAKLAIRNKERLRDLIAREPRVRPIIGVASMNGISRFDHHA